MLHSFDRLSTGVVHIQNWRTWAEIMVVVAVVMRVALMANGIELGAAIGLGVAISVIGLISKILRN